MGRHYLLPFTPYYDFVVERPMIIHGVALDRGDRVPKDKLNERRLRQLYEQRKIKPAAFGEAAPPAFLGLGIGVADKLAAELAAEEGGDDASAPTAPPTIESAPAVAAAAPPAAKAVDAKPTARKPRAKRAA
jgi:hypothetical protein